MSGYVYKLKFKTHEKYYVGSRKYSGNPLDDLLNRYFTSSKVVALFIGAFGLNDIEILDIKQFKSFKEAVEYEDGILRSIPIEEKIKYLNLNFSAGGSIIKSQTHISITNDNKTYVFFPRDIPIPKGYWIKYNQKPPTQKGMRTYINPTTQHKLKMRLPLLPPDGYISSSQYSKNEKAKAPKRTEWITNGSQNRKILKGDVPPVGWHFGKTITVSEEGKKRQRAAHLGKRGGTKNTRCITNGVIRKFIDKNQEIPEGWRLGRRLEAESSPRKPKTGKRWIITSPFGVEELVTNLREYGIKNNLKSTAAFSAVARGKLPHHCGYKARYAND